MTFAQLAFDVDGAQTAENGTLIPSAPTVNGTRRGRRCARCAALSASPTAPASGARCTSCRFAADHAGRRCAFCGAPIPPGKKSTTRYCSRRCKDRADEARAAERDHAAGVPHARLRCQCERPVLVYDPDLRETRDLLCGRPR